MDIVPKYTFQMPKYTNSIYSIEYQKQIIKVESSKHDWKIEVKKNYAEVISANNHKFSLHFNSTLEQISCSCLFFAEQELNWCQHCEVLKKWIDSNIRNNLFYMHQKKLDMIFFDGINHNFYSSAANKYFKYDELVLSGLPLAPSIFNIKKPTIYNGIEPKELALLPNISFYPYQYEAIAHMLKYKRTILSLEMGWGKTLCAINCIAHILKDKPDAKILIFCPKSLKKQWEDEIKKHLNVSVSNLKTNKIFLNFSTVTIANYEMARNDIFLNQPYDILILDEVQKIKNKDTQAWKGISKIKFDWAWALSGTLVENNIEDFLSIADILLPDLLRVRWKFYDKYCEIDKKYIKGFKNSKELNEMLSRIIYRAPTDQAPININHKKELIKVTMSSKQKSIHDNYMYQVNKLLAIAGNRALTYAEKISLAAMQTKARMASDGLLDKTEVPEKIKKIINIIKQTNEKIVVFSEWKEFLTILENELDKLNIKSVRFDGELSANKRNHIVEEFINNHAIRVFASTDAGGIGIDGLQLVSSKLIHCQNVWNPARIQQRDGRLVRIKQKNDVISYMIISSDSIEESMLINHKRKDDIKKVILMESK